MINLFPLYPTTDSATTVRKLRSFEQLPVGWHYGSGGPASRTVIDAAVSLYEQMVSLGLTRTDAFPGAEGEIQVTAYHRQHFVAVTIDPHLAYTVCHEDGDVDCCEVEGGNRAEAIEQLREITREIWGSSVSSTPGIMIPTAVGLGTWHSRSPLAGACLSSTPTALKQPAVA